MRFPLSEEHLADSIIEGSLTPAENPLTPCSFRKSSSDHTPKRPYPSWAVLSAYGPLIPKERMIQKLHQQDLPMPVDKVLTYSDTKSNGGSYIQHPMINI